VSTRLDLVLQKHPDHEDAIRLLASRDPSGNLKYLDWGAKILVSGQALAPEIADVLDLFHQFAGRRLDQATRRGRPTAYLRRSKPGQRVNPDIYSYRPGDLAKLRDLLLKIQRAQNKKRRERERLYRIEGEVETEVVYDAPDVVVRHIKNKQASVHYGLQTKWCISMLREGYFEDYEAHNATFFFFERKEKRGDEYDKIALMMPRSDEHYGEHQEVVCAYTALDHRVDMMVLAKVYGPSVFDIFRAVWECSNRYPGSTMAQVYAGQATQEQLEAAYASVTNVGAAIGVRGKKGLSWHETHMLLESICCNDAASQTLLEEVARRAYELSIAAWRREGGGRNVGFRRRGRRRKAQTGRAKKTAEDLVCTIAMALSIHPNMPVEFREQLTKNLRRRRLVDIHRVKSSGRIGVTDGHRGGRKVRRYRRRLLTVKALRAHAQVLDRRAARMRKKARTLQRKLTEAKKRKALRARKACRKK